MEVNTYTYETTFVYNPKYKNQQNYFKNSITIAKSLASSSSVLESKVLESFRPIVGLSRLNIGRDIV